MTMSLDQILNQVPTPDAGAQANAGMNQGIQTGMALAKTQAEVQQQQVQTKQMQDQLDMSKFNSMVGMTRSYLSASDGVKKLLAPQIQDRMNKMGIANPDYVKSLDDPEMQDGMKNYLDAMASGHIPQDPDTARNALKVAGDLGTQSEFLSMGAEARKTQAAQALANLKASNESDLKDKELNSNENVAKIKGQYELAAAKARAIPGQQRALTKNFVDTQNSLEQIRSQPAVQQAEKDIYAGQKLTSLIGDDPDKASPQMVQLAATEVAKMAAGGAPSMHELDGLNPKTIPSKLASAAQSAVNSPTAANAGAFLQQYQDYANKITTDAQKVITDRSGRILNSRKKLLSPDEFDTLNDNYVNRFIKPQANPAATAPAAQNSAPPPAAGGAALTGAVAALRAAKAPDDVIAAKLKARNYSDADIQKALGK